MNWPLLVLLGIIAASLIVFLIVRNMRDAKKFENQLNRNYPKPRKDEEDVEPEDIPR